MEPEHDMPGSAIAQAEVSQHSQILGQESATTRALFCREIADSIFSHLSLNSEIFFRAHEDYFRQHHNKAEQREKRQTLASAARVSRYFSEIALSVLWAQQSGFGRLFGLLPQYTSSWASDDASAGLNGDPTNQQWVTLQKYAALVRGVFFLSLAPSEQELWSIILDRFGSISEFLPRLTELGVLHVNPERPMSEPFFLSPALKHLSIQLDSSSFYPDAPDFGMRLTTALEHIVTAIPSLSSLKIDDRWHDAKSLSWTMPLFKCIRDLDITPQLTVNASILVVIGRFEHLRTLSVHIADNPTHLRGCFQSLTQLKIGGHALHIQSFLVTTAPPLLQSLSLFFLHARSTERLTGCISTVLSRVPSTLSTLLLESNLTFEPMITSVMDIIQPALALRSLSSFAFNFRLLSSISDADIAAMLAAWPLLAALRIHDGQHPTVPARAPMPPGARPTAAILPTIAVRCPHLRELKLPEVDLAATPPLNALPPPLSPAHGLRVLDLTSWCDDRHACMRAAVMLDRLFPCMQLPLVRRDVYDEKGEKGWAAVMQLLEAMQAGRAHAEAFEVV